MKLKTLALSAVLSAIAVSAVARDIEMQSIYPNTLPLLGSSGAELGGRVSSTHRRRVEHCIPQPRRNRRR